MKRSSVLGQGVTTQRNFLRENKLLVQQTPMLTMRRKRMSPSYELPTTASMGRRAVTPPLIETQRRLIEGGRAGRDFYAEAQRRSSSEKEIQTEDISDEQFLNAALLKCTEHGHGQGQAQLLRGCSEGDEPLLMASFSGSGYDDTGGLRRTASNFELGKLPAQRSSYHTVLSTRAGTLPRRLDVVMSCAETQQQEKPTKIEKEADADNEAVNDDADDRLSISSGKSSPHVMQLSIPDITDVEQNPQLDQPLSARTNASCRSKASIRADKTAVAIKAVEERERERERQRERERDQDQVLLTEPQRVALLQAAQARYRDLIWQYNRLPISMGTLRVRNLKIELEHELDRIDNDLSMLTLPQVYIRRDQLQQISSISC